MAQLRLVLVCALGVLLVLLLPQAATAGGWWSEIDVKRSHVAPGQRVEVDETVLFSSVAAAEEAQEAGRFHVHLLGGFDDSIVERAMRKPFRRSWWSLGDAQAIRVGEVTVSVSDVNVGKATAAFTMPDLPAATYHLMLCDAACTEPLADVIPATDFTVVADPATAQMAQRADRLARRIRDQARQLSTARTDARRALIAGWNASSEVVTGVLAGALALRKVALRATHATRRPPPEVHPFDAGVRQAWRSPPHRASRACRR